MIKNPKQTKVEKAAGDMLEFLAKMGGGSISINGKEIVSVDDQFSSEPCPHSAL